jgi:hypothetical protein
MSEIAADILAACKKKTDARVLYNTDPKFCMWQRHGSSSAVGAYEGALYCIRCNFSSTPENLATCNKEGQEHCLLMKDGHVPPLYGITKDIADKINAQALHEKQVKIRGRYYPVTNAILVSQVEPVTR